MEYRTYIRAIEVALGEALAADGIDEGVWKSTFMASLAQVSTDLARGLELESAARYTKPGDRVLAFEAAPPTRLLALALACVAWLGWVMREKHGDAERPFSAAECMGRIADAYYSGVALSRSGERP